MKILYFAPIYYDDMKQRPQQIADELAKKHEVYYIEPTVSFIRWLLKGGRSFAGMKKKLPGGLKVIRLNGCLTIYKSIEIMDLCGINSLSELWQLQRLKKICDIVWVGYSGWYTVVRHIKDKPVIFDKMDEEDLLVSSKLLKKTLRRNQRNMVRMASAVTVTCRQFYEELKNKKDKVTLIPNAVSSNFAYSMGENNICFGRVHPVRTFGYIGTIGEWFDTAVIYKLLELDGRFEIFLAGRNYLPEIKNPRVHYLGIKKNNELPEFLQSVDVCLFNFKKSQLLDTVNPVKIYEYLSLNKPVLAVKSKETMQFRDYAVLYEDTDALKWMIQKGFQRPFANMESLRQFVDRNSWAARAAQVEQILREEAGKKHDEGDVSLWNKAGGD